jgi:hypothetical protein
VGDRARPDDSPGPVLRGHHPEHSAGVSPCFHPGDDAALAESRPRAADARHVADDLAVDLHLALNGIDEKQLGALARSQP